MDIKKLNALVGDINKEHENHLFISLDGGSHDIARTSAGRLSIDIPFGGGVPDGKIIELYGQESSGKTTIALHMIAAHQEAKPEKAAAFLDYEHAFDRKYAEALGVDISSLVFAQPMFAEEGLEGIDALISSGKFSIIVVDSVSAMTPKSELEGDMDKATMGVQAKLMSKAMRKLVGKANANKTTVIFLNQMREKIGIMFGSPWTTTGGNALKFFSSIRAEVKRSSKIKGSEDEGIVGNIGRLVVTKNKTAAPYQESEYEIQYGLGISEIEEVIHFAVGLKIVKKAGSWYSYQDTKLGQGKIKVKALLEDNPELLEELKTKILEAYGL